MTVDSSGPPVNDLVNRLNYQMNCGVNYCFNRLPCGYCRLLDRPCPMTGNSYVEPTWKLPEITCKEET